jgi:hypothetical protein
MVCHPANYNSKMMCHSLKLPRDLFHWDWPNSSTIEAHLSPQLPPSKPIKVHHEASRERGGRLATHPSIDLVPPQTRRVTTKKKCQKHTHIWTVVDQIRPRSWPNGKDVACCWWWCIVKPSVLSWPLTKFHWTKDVSLAQLVRVRGVIVHSNHIDSSFL